MSSGNEIGSFRNAVNRVHGPKEKEMDFAFSEDQEMVRDLVNQIFGGSCSHERSKAVEDAGLCLDEDLWKDLAGANLTALCVPESLGGSGLGLIECALVLQEAGRHCAPAPLLETLILGSMPIAKFGTDAQRKQWLAPVANDAAVLTAAFDEAGSSNPAKPRLCAVRDGEGWKLSGEKICVPAAERASGILVPAAIEGGKVGVFLVAPGTPGLEILPQKSINWQAQAMLQFTDAAVAADALLGDENSGVEIVEWTLDRARLAVSAIMLGVGEEALKRTAAFLSERKQFGRQIGSFQAVQMRCADAYIDLEGMRSALWQAVWRVDEGLRAGAEICAAKWWASRAGDRVTHSAQHLHGGIGSDIDYPIHRYFLWAQQLSNQFGGPTQQLAELGKMLVNEDTRPSL
ncbi:MAG: alkylation response protein AidB-like acyl-CoA dehydrogenase [Myxococcota bacterium]